MYSSKGIMLHFFTFLIHSIKAILSGTDNKLSKIDQFRHAFLAFPEL